MIKQKAVVFQIVAFFLGIIICFQAKAQNQDKPNILFICVDDLRPELACYGKDYIQSPHMDKLAKEGFLFKQHFVTVPTCGASRHSLLTGKLPSTRDDLRNSATADQITGKPETEVPETFIHHLKRNGYHTVGVGKITHHPDGRVYAYKEPVSNKMELPHSWDEFIFDFGKWGTGHNAFFGYADGSNRNTLNGQVKPYEKADVPDDGYPDGVIAKVAINKLQKLKENGEPFFLGVGFFKPHLPFNAPSKYWDLYDTADIPLSPNGFLPENVNTKSLQTMGEFNNYKLGDEKASLDKALSEAYAKKLGHAYAACVSYVDAQIGSVLNELKRLDLDKNTIIVIWGDHGWHLGDHRVWGKHTLMDRALHSTLMMKIPGQNMQGETNKVVSTVDIYPTLMELCQLEMPYSTKGRSLVTLMQNPEEVNWEEAAYSFFRSGISLRTSQYRFSKHFREDLPAIELFDHQSDPYETINVADKNKKVVKKLMPLWDKGNTGLFD
ncbi:sulfatase [Flexithrix dorotheae]|uniref:sulfatase n=1 Tax=Flexithrix dorotheae TaxID=70993 RepID=UPI000362D958|nr:sulfatase [Flexithrix dorotheae]